MADRSAGLKAAAMLRVFVADESATTVYILPARRDSGGRPSIDPTTSLAEDLLPEWSWRTGLHAERAVDGQLPPGSPVSSGNR